MTEAELTLEQDGAERHVRERPVALPVACFLLRGAVQVPVSAVEYRIR